MLVPLGLAVLIAAGQTGAAPSPTASPLKEIIRVRSTPFCTVFRENVFRALQGLMLNDTVIAQGNDLLARMGGDPYGREMGQYQLGQTVYQAASNLTKVYQLLDDPNRFPQSSTAEGDRDLLLMKARLEAVADAQERSLNVLSGTYETSMLNDLRFRGTEFNDALGNGSPDEAVDKPPNDDTKSEKILALDTPMLGSGVPQPGQEGSPQPLAGTRRLTGRAENLVASALLPGVNRCDSN